MQPQFHLGLNTSAIFRMKGTKYDCNPIQKRPYISAIFKIVLNHVTMISGQSREMKFSIIALI